MIGRLGTFALGAGVATSLAATLLWLRLAVTTAPVRLAVTAKAATPVRSAVTDATAPPASGLASTSALRLARALTAATLVAAALACGALEWALLRHDFSVRFVAENGGRHVPVYYTVTSLWSALDGSLLLWVLILAGYAALLGRSAPVGDRRPQHRDYRPRYHGARLHRYTMSLVSTVTVFFFALAYFAANPFQQVRPVPADGPGPNPLLQQHPAMGLHPPLLYAGYIGLVVPFAYALAGLLARPAGGAWLAPARTWALSAWTLLTAGIVLGAWWSYAVLGWGGYWAWDPVENASLLPWLTCTAFLHSALSRRGRSPSGWPVGLACASFLLVLVGTFLTRSGVVASVHAFSESALGPMLLAFIVLAAVGAIALIGWRGGPAVTPPEAVPLLSRRTALLGNRILLTSIAAVVLLGTVFPLLTQATTGVRTAVGPEYFNRAALPLVIALLTLMGLAPLLRRDTRETGRFTRSVAVPAAAGLAAVTATGLLGRPGPLALAAFGCAAFVLAGIVTSVLPQRLSFGRVDTAGASASEHDRRRVQLEPTASPPRSPAWQRPRRRRLGGTLAHAGITVVAIGVAASSAYTQSAERELTIGQSITVGDTSARLAAIDRTADRAGMRVQVRLVLAADGRPRRQVLPTLAYYPQRDLTTSVPAIHSGPLRDTYATLVAVSPDRGSATIRLAVNPMVALIWAGGALTAAGGLLALAARPRRRPVDPPATRRVAESAAVPVTGAAGTGARP